MDNWRLVQYFFIWTYTATSREKEQRAVRLFSPFGYSVCHHFQPILYDCFNSIQQWQWRQQQRRRRRWQQQHTNNNNKWNEWTISHVWQVVVGAAWDDTKIALTWLTDWHRPNAHYVCALIYSWTKKCLKYEWIGVKCASYALELFSFSSSLFKSNFNYWTFIQWDTFIQQQQQPTEFLLVLLVLQLLLLGSLK